MRKLLILALFSFFFFGWTQAQQYTSETTSTPKAPIVEALKQGSFTGNLRAYFMETINKDSLTDFDAIALGTKLKYESARYKGIKLGLAYYSTVNTGLFNPAELDPYTLRSSRFESGLFDVNDPTQNEVVILGESYLNYTFKKHDFTLGRFLYNSPLINGQDGRMIPTLVEGFHYTNQSLKNTAIEFLYLNKIAPRSTDDFVRIEDSFGLYPSGLSAVSGKSKYSGNTTTPFVAVGSIHYKKEVNEVKVYNYFVANVFNTLFVEFTKQLAVVKPKSNSSILTASVQAIRQDRVNNGGNESIEFAYFDQKQSNLFGAQIKLASKKNSFRIATNHVTGDGRFLFPREWGREFLFTFQKRERTEGQAKALNFLAEYSTKQEFKSKSNLKAIVGYGIYLWEQPNQPLVNKYSIPAFHQINLDFIYTFSGLFNGMSVEYLAVIKPSLLEQTNPNFTLNKVNTFNQQLIFNYRF